MSSAAQKQNFSFYTSAEYWTELRARLAKTIAGDRIALMAMDFDSHDPIVAGICKELLAAAQRGVDTHLIVDGRSFLFDPHAGKFGPLWYGRPLEKADAIFQPRLHTIRQLQRQSHGHATITNRPLRRFSNIYAGRSHIKFSLINDTIFIGGCNLYDTQFLDLMTCWDDRRTSDDLFDFVKRIETHEHVGQALDWHDQEFAIHPDATLFIDAGARRQSIIFDHALQLIDEAQKHITITCQFFPNSRTAQRLAAAHRRGVDVTVLFAHPSKHGKGFRRAGQYYNVWRERRRVPAALFAHGLTPDMPMLHAKLLATDAGTMIGSHNYVRAGVNLGTAEIALLFRDPAYSKAALAALSRELPLPTKPAT